MLATPLDGLASGWRALAGKRGKALAVKSVIVVLLVVDVLEVFGFAVSGCRLDDLRAAGRSVSAPLGKCSVTGGGVNGGKGRTINRGMLARGLVAGGLAPGWPPPRDTCVGERVSLGTNRRLDPELPRTGGLAAMEITR
jgi:hypothetical protein